MWNLFKKELDKDEKVIEALKEHGSNIDNPHSIDFWLDFDNEASARKAAEILLEKGFGSKILKSQDHMVYTCQANKELIPSLDTMRSITSEFDEIAKSLGGNYDGWGAEIVP